jgi:hypothetical protein
MVRGRATAGVSERAAWAGILSCVFTGNSFLAAPAAVEYGFIIQHPLRFVIAFFPFCEISQSLCGKVPFIIKPKVFSGRVKNFPPPSRVVSRRE